ncbi:3-oxoacyl-[acyl-carrier-protein] reductase FabG-like isoform X2 [Clavelina lepadiformis]|uniref:3-oxoacyl-[acyl-carrier-protein] reductase FabG-like isoform X2 n=1 Tax=Clavelina lepadiformis TaxID=159417 RepID=UPI004041A64D
MVEFASKVVLVTGAASGVGAGTAKTFAKHGTRLCLVDRDEENLAKTETKCENVGAEKVLTIVADLTKYEDLKRVIQKTIEEFTELDVLLNIAGICFKAPMEIVSFKDFDAAYNINVRAPLFLTQLAIPYLEKTKGSIVNISSIASKKYTEASQMIYSMSKSSVDHFTKIAALELAKKGIRINAVNPAFMKTNLFQRWLKSDEEVEELVQERAKLVPLGRKNVKVDDVIDAIMFLASDRAKMITGTCLFVDGARHLTGM